MAIVEGDARVEVRLVTTDVQLAHFKLMTRQYLEWLGEDLGFQGVERELASLPGRRARKAVAGVRLGRAALRVCVPTALTALPPPTTSPWAATPSTRGAACCWRTRARQTAAGLAEPTPTGAAPRSMVEWRWMGAAEGAAYTQP